MPKFRLTGNYGTFVITQDVLAADEEEARCLTGIMAPLEEEGWTFLEGPDGEEWTCEELNSKRWEPTHVHVSADGSVVRLIETKSDGRQLVENECGEVWADPAGTWVPVTP